MNRMKASLLIAALAGCAAKGDVSSTQQQVSKSEFAERAHCNAYACMLWRAQDRDQDGIADIDEEALGTDPDSILSRPSDDAVFQHIGFGDLPSYNEGLLTVVVLPTKTPEGEDIFGGESGKPAREELFRQLKMGEILGSFDLSHGIVLNPKLGGPDITVPWFGKRDSQSDYMSMANDLAKLSPNPQVVDDVNAGLRSDGGGMQFGSLELTHRNGATDQINWQSLGNAQRGTMVSRDPNGKVIQTASIKVTDNSSGGVDEKTTETTIKTDGFSSTVKETESRGATGSWRSTESNVTTKEKDGSTVNVKSSKTSETSGGETQSHETTVTTRCENGTCGDPVVTEKDNGETITPTKCEASADACEVPEGGYAYRDPDYIEPDPDTAAVSLKLDSSPVHIYNDPMVPPGTTPEPSAPPEGTGVIILTTGDVESTILLRDDWTFGTVQPDFDPSLAEPPPSQLPDVGSCLDC